MIDTKKELSDLFQSLHDRLYQVQKHLQEARDQEAMTLFNQMEMGLLAPMRRLRVHLNIPYDWRRNRPVKEIPTE